MKKNNKIFKFDAILKEGKRNLSFLIFCFILFGCKKLVHIPEPINTITSAEAFSTQANATSAIVGIYSGMSWSSGNRAYANGEMSIIPGLSADELSAFAGPNNGFYYFQQNLILSSYGECNNFFWRPIYSDIYKTNAAVEGIQASTTLSKSVKNQLTGEAKFIRAFCYFYLVNLFGDGPLDTTTAWAQTSLLAKAPTEKIYQQIVEDLKSAQQLLPEDYSIANKERTRANRWAASAMLARVYLYQQQWAAAEEQSTQVINNSLYSLTTDLNSAFLKNNNEAIFQLELINNYPWATQEGNQLIPQDSTSSPVYCLTSQLLNAFEPSDKRRLAWVDSTHYSGVYYFYPYKYKVRQGTSGNISEYYTLLRLAEQYLIRAEARIEQKNLVGGLQDLNTIRNRAGLMDLSDSLNPAQCLAALAQERRIELFSEWGHRWFDLKRTGQADAILSLVKPQWKATAKLYPIPLSEIQLDPNLKQNPGY